MASERKVASNEPIGYLRKKTIKITNESWAPVNVVPQPPRRYTSDHTICTVLETKGAIEDLVSAAGSTSIIWHCYTSGVMPCQVPMGFHVSMAYQWDRILYWVSEYGCMYKCSYTESGKFFIGLNFSQKSYLNGWLLNFQVQMIDHWNFVWHRTEPINFPLYYCGMTIPFLWEYREGAWW